MAESVPAPETVKVFTLERATPPVKAPLFWVRVTDSAPDNSLPVMFMAAPAVSSTSVALAALMSTTPVLPLAALTVTEVASPALKVEAPRLPSAFTTRDCALAASIVPAKVVTSVFPSVPSPEATFRVTSVALDNVIVAPVVSV